MFPEKGSALFPLLLSRLDIGRPRCMIDSSRTSGTVVSWSRGVLLVESDDSSTMLIALCVGVSSREPLREVEKPSSRELFLTMTGVSSREFFLAMILAPNFSRGPPIDTFRGAS